MAPKNLGFGRKVGQTFRYGRGRNKWAFIKDPQQAARIERRRAKQAILEAEARKTKKKKAVVTAPIDVTEGETGEIEVTEGEGEGEGETEEVEAAIPSAAASILGATAAQPGAAASALGGEIPPWWINRAFVNPNERQAFANAANALLPTLSPEDQRNLALYLSTNFPKAFGAYSTAAFAPIPTQVGAQERQQYLSPERANFALELLKRMKKASGKENLGPGFSFLTSAVDLMNRFNTGGPMTREQYAQFSQAVSDITSQAGKSLSAYGNLAQLFNLPGFSAGPIVSNLQNRLLNV